MRAQPRVEGLNPDIWAENDYAIIDPDINKRVGRIYPEIILGEPKRLWFLQTERRCRPTATRPARSRKPKQRSSGAMPR
jgi:hypothetical protein